MDGLSRKARRRCALDDSTYTAFLVTLLCFVALLQIMLRFDSLRMILNDAIRLEGHPLSPVVQGLNQPAYTWLDWPLGDGKDRGIALVYLRFLRAPKTEAWILINGYVLKKATGDTVIACADGDYIELFSQEDITCIVSAVTDNVTFPLPGFFLSGRGKMSLGKARIIP